MQNIDEALDLLEANGIKVEMTEEQRAARRARAKARRERKKREQQPYYVKLVCREMGVPTVYRGYANLEALTKDFKGPGLEKLLNGGRINYDVDEIAKIISRDEIPTSILTKIVEDLAHGKASSEHSNDW